MTKDVLGETCTGSTCQDRLEFKAQSKEVSIRSLGSRSSKRIDSTKLEEAQTPSLSSLRYTHPHQQATVDCFAFAVPVVSHQNFW